MGQDLTVIILSPPVTQKKKHTFFSPTDCIHQKSLPGTGIRHLCLVHKTYDLYHVPIEKKVRYRFH